MRRNLQLKVASCGSATQAMRDNDIRQILWGCGMDPRDHGRAKSEESEEKNNALII